MKIPQKRSRAGRPAKGDKPKALIGRKLKAIQGGMKNSAFEEILGVGPSAYANYLSGKRVPDARALARLSEETRVDLNWLLDDDDPTPENAWPVLLPDDSGGIGRPTVLASGGEGLTDSPATPQAPIDAHLVQHLRAQLTEANERIGLLFAELAEARRERDAALEASKTAGRLLDEDEAAGA